MKITEPKWSPYSDEFNNEALTNPLPGDYWQERFSPYFLVVRVNGDEITVLSCLGGEHTVNRKHELNARVADGQDHWRFDYSKHMVVTRDWMRKAVTYGSIEGFMADVVRSEKFIEIAEEWKQFHRDRLHQELAQLA